MKRTMSWIFQNPEARMITDTMVEGVRKVRNGSTMRMNKVRMNKVVDEIRIEKDPCMLSGPADDGRFAERPCGGSCLRPQDGEGVQP